jgi:hypothetical protein
MAKQQTTPVSLNVFSLGILADPVTKLNCPEAVFKNVNGVLDARIYLKNTHGYEEWLEGQEVYENWAASGKDYQERVKSYREEIERDRPTYSHFVMNGDILDVGGGGWNRS